MTANVFIFSLETTFVASARSSTGQTVIAKFTLVVCVTPGGTPLCSDAVVNGEAVVSVDLSEEEEKAVVKLAKPLEANQKAVFKCNFVGELNDKMRGERPIGVKLAH